LSHILFFLILDDVYSWHGYIVYLILVCQYTCFVCVQSRPLCDNTHRTDILDHKHELHSVQAHEHQTFSWSEMSARCVAGIDVTICIYSYKYTHFFLLNINNLGNNNNIIHSINIRVMAGDDCSRDGRSTIDSRMGRVQIILVCGPGHRLFVREQCKIQQTINILIKPNVHH